MNPSMAKLEPRPMIPGDGSPSKSISLAQDGAKSRRSCRSLGSSRLSQVILLGK